MSVYRLTQTDTEKAMKVVELFFNRNASIPQIELFLSGKNNYLLTYEDKHKLVGFAYGYELQRFDGRKNMMYMHQVEVLPEHRKQGIGKKLMKSFIEICKQNDCERLFLITNKSNVPAVTLYNGVGGKTFHDDDILYAVST
ncbi:GNAT family N-acetyltransferase [Bacillus shivajii]|uniref:GNAT family N-acetyltransferase n=1 Tax=Bacillus shivajii TaxID=1983719 RepID=UPI001CFBF83C|nr:GNAT family N-acetyltransferase [Bacillus shivajii]UCZ53454.1 GNAT family N-acetyltransferase [Bacillus shivajii]